MSILNKDIFAADLILERPKALLMFEHLGVELPISSKTLLDVCYEQKVSFGLFTEIAELFLFDKKPNLENVSIADTPALLSYLSTSHSYYINEQFPKIKKSLNELSELCEKTFAAIFDKFFEDYYAEVFEHLQYENQVVFPYIQNLYDSVSDGASLKDKSFKISTYKDNHSDIEEKISDLKNLLIKHLPKNNDRSARRNLLTNVCEFEVDLTIHSRIEDEILTPLVLELEKKSK